MPLPPDYCNCICHNYNGSHSMQQCSKNYCVCRTQVSIQQASNNQMKTFNMASNSQNIGRLDHRSSFKPIPTEATLDFKNDKDVLSKDFNILTLNNMRSDNLDARSPKKTIGVKSVISSARCPTKLSEPDNSKKFLTPADFFSTANIEMNNTKTVGAARRITFPSVPIPSSPSASAVSPLLGTRSVTPSRTTPLTVDMCLKRLVAPDEFLASSQVSKREEELSQNTGCNSVQMTSENHYKSSDSLFLRNKPSSVLKTVIGTPKPTCIVESLVKSGEQPLNQFFAEIGVTADHNQLLPTIPGGKNIVQRLDTPDTNVIAGLRRANGEAATDADKTENNAIISKKDMIYQIPKDQDRAYIAVFWDIENCQVSHY